MSGNEQVGRRWTPVPPAVAAQYRWYGVGGWLAFFLVLLTIGCIAAFGLWIWLASEILPDFGTLAGGWKFRLGGLLLLFGAMVVLLVVALVRGFGLNPAFPTTIRWYLGLSILVSFFDHWVEAELDRLMGVSTTGAMIAGRIGGAVLGNALLIWYFTSSKRVNATYLHRLDAGHPSSAALLEGAAAVPPPAAAASPAAVPAAPVAPPPAAAPPVAPPAFPPPAAAPGRERSVQQRLAELKALREQELIDEETYRERQAAIVKDL